MPSVVLDGLWECLCPSVPRNQLARYRLARTAWTVPHTRPSIERRSYARCVQGLPNARRQFISLYAFKPPVRCQGFYSTERRYNKLSYVRQDPTTQYLYEQLRQASRKADHQQVQRLVKTLVEGHRAKPNQRLYLALVLANADPDHGSPREVKALLQEMVDLDINPDAAILHAALKALSIHPNYLLRSDILEELHQRWFSLTTDGWHDVIIGLLRDRQLEVALSNLEILRNQGVPIASWLNDIIAYTLCDMGELDEALKLMRHRISTGEHKISAILWSHFLDAASRSFHHDATLFAWRLRVETGYLNPSSGMCINVLNTAARRRDPQLASEVFRVLDKRKHTFQLHHYEALLESWLASGDLKAAISVLCSMVSSGVQPPEASTRAIYIHLAAKYDRPAQALEILHSLRESDYRIPHAAINCIIEAYIHHNDLASAIETYQTLHSIIPSGPNTATFNALFRGCSYARRKDLAMFLASEMLALNVPPNALTYDRLILVCLNESLDMHEGFEDAWKYFVEMKSMGWWPRGGTLKALGIRGCMLAEKRVAELVDVQRGLAEKRMEYLMWMYWGQNRRETPDSPAESGSAHEHDVVEDYRRDGDESIVR